eukprot:CAMPEP_0172733708 /NCGR_PEP_ID=MMETSP1074-20121228/107871_1 /TAXON_ID=2916 /ORGANISM="Ceratium fusus, Strain PA161109" /LENGTH=74 /DNA_ID=CAMNT_0013562321 /DNA_START=8 /DNA_END=229 /DNA_ORIENTATION=+
MMNNNGLQQLTLRQHALSPTDATRCCHMLNRGRSTSFPSCAASGHGKFSRIADAAKRANKRNSGEHSTKPYTSK